MACPALDEVGGYIDSCSLDAKAVTQAARGGLRADDRGGLHDLADMPPRGLATPTPKRRVGVVTAGKALQRSEQNWRNWHGAIGEFAPFERSENHAR